MSHAMYNLRKKFVFIPYHQISFILQAFCNEFNSLELANSIDSVYDDNQFIKPSNTQELANEIDLVIKH